GLWDGLKDTATEAVNTVKHPVKTVKDIGKAAAHPVKTGKAIYTAVKKVVVEDVINGTADTRAHFAGEAVVQVGLAVVGTKGVDKALKVIKANKAAKAVSIIDDLEDISSDITKADRAINKAGTSIDDVIKEMNEPAKVNKAVNVADDVTEGAGNSISSSVDYYVGPNGKALASQYKDWIGTNIQEELLKQAENPQLQNAIKQLYRGKSFIGNGGTADVIRFEKETSIMLGKNGGSHIQKGIDMASYIENKILKQTLSTLDRGLGEKLLNDLNKALGR
ncbi:MAG: hypothetical protein WCD89_02640, partial [Anaerocolumna sp.]